MSSRTLPTGLLNSDSRFHPEMLLWAVAVGVVFATGYLGIPKLLGDGTGLDLSIGLESYIPYAGWAAIPYTLGYAIILGPAIPFHEPHYVKRGAASYLVAMAVCFALFLLLPVRCIPPPATGPIDSFLLPRLPWLNDRGWNSFPSLHVAMATLSCLSLLKVNRTVTALSLLVWVSVFASTLLLKRHYLADGLAGTGLGILIYYIVVEPEFRRRGVAWAL